MRTQKSLSVAAVVMFLVASMTNVLAQGPLHKRVEFTINSSFEMHNSDMVLPAGKYILYQIHQNDPNLFAMYSENLMHSPIAMVRTTRIDFLSGDYPDKVRMLADLDEENSTALPVITGWTIPGEDGWEILATVPDRDKVISRITKNHRRNGRVIIVTTASGF